MTIEADFSGLNTLTFDLGRAAATTVTKAQTAVRLAGLSCERDAKIFAPVDTGNLRNSISSTIVGLTATIGPTAEYGTSRMAPHAYMGPALDRAGATLAQAIEQITRSAL